MVSPLSNSRVGFGAWVCLRKRQVLFFFNFPGIFLELRMNVWPCIARPCLEEYGQDGFVTLASSSPFLFSLEYVLCRLMDLTCRHVVHYYPNSRSTRDSSFCCSSKGWGACRNIVTRAYFSRATYFSFLLILDSFWVSPLVCLYFLLESPSANSVKQCHFQYIIPFHSFTGELGREVVNNC